MITPKSLVGYYHTSATVNRTCHPCLSVVGIPHYMTTILYTVFQKKFTPVTFTITVWNENQFK